MEIAASRSAIRINRCCIAAMFKAASYLSDPIPTRTTSGSYGYLRYGLTPALRQIRIGIWNGEHEKRTAKALGELCDAQNARESLMQREASRPANASNALDWPRQKIIRDF